MSVGFAAAAVGVETCGDITYPAQNSGVVGLKPTVGLVPRSGIVPVSSFKDTVGPITRTVKDAAIVLSVIAGRCIFDPATIPIPFETVPDYVAACKPDSLRGARIAVSFAPNHIMKAIEAALQVMESAGAEIIRDYDLVGWNYGVSERSRMPDNVMLREGLEAYFQTLATNPHGIYTMADLVSFTAMTPAENAVGYGLEGFLAARDETHTSSSPEFHAEVHRMLEQGSAIAKMLDTASCDALVVPTQADIPSDLGQNPVIAVPLGFRPPTTRALRSNRTLPKDRASQMIGKGPNSPFSLSFVGRRFSEEKLIGLAYAFEQKTNVLAKSRTCVQSTVPILPGPCPSGRERIGPANAASAKRRGAQGSGSK
ncbi:amidase signature domain-containing protein [Chaetomium tenue]|uniref:Amidase signature domain-containing protein n=1 Tax=Chaetomium tenue TaxID=1854479 RepID=A0ACB7NXH9_9PEZI|nr:amidase signature domain-containing protein [Chaetomium globosum]